MAGVLGIGIDTVELERVAQALRTPGFGDRVFTPEELALPLPSIAARWAAREAAVKALGGLHGLALRDFAVQRVPLGAPKFAFSEAARTVLHRLGAGRMHVSLSHDRRVATAMVLAERAAE